MLVKPMMFYHSININKTNNHLSYQIIEHENKPRHMAFDNNVLAWDRRKNVAVLIG